MSIDIVKERVTQIYKYLEALYHFILLRAA